MSGGESVGCSRRGVSRPSDARLPGALGHRQECLSPIPETGPGHVICPQPAPEARHRLGASCLGCYQEGEVAEGLASDQCTGLEGYDARD
jgi:hypothetical protein